MNKLTILLLAVCLISVHAFVKRDAPETATQNDFIESMKKTGEEIKKKIGEINIESISKSVSETIDTIKKNIESFAVPKSDQKPESEAPKA